MTISTDGIHVFVFCCAEYEHLLDNCLDSIKNNIVDNILSINIVSNKTLTRDKCTSIKDPEFWKLLDPDFVYRNLYNHNWVKQQILKLSVDRYVTGNVLIVDADVIFTGPTRWIQDNKVNMYTHDYTVLWGWEESANNFTKTILDVDKQFPSSLVSESMVFLTEVLVEIKTEIENKYKKSWLTVFDEFLLVGADRSLDYTLSEYEFYGNYFCKKYKNLVDIKKKTSDNFVTQIIDIKSHTGTKTNWLTFYQQVRGDNWPDCDNEEDFDNLPNHIKKECIEEFGYIKK